jgi:hypothetical protein
MTDFSNRDIDATMSRFEAAATATQLDVPRIEVRRALLALDGSNQDHAVLNLSRALMNRLGRPVLLTYAYDQPTADPEKDRYLAEQAAALAGGGIETAHARDTSGGRAFQQILKLAETHACGLLVLPSPYLEDFQGLGLASVGTTTDVLLHQQATPLLIVRKPAESVRDRLENVVLPLNLVSPQSADAVAWALKLVPEGGMVHLLAVVDEEMLDAVRHLLAQSFEAKDIDDATLGGLGRSDMAGFVATMQSRAAEATIDCRVSVRQGSFIPTIAEFANAEPCLLIIGCGGDCAARNYQWTLALVRQSVNPVLVV